MVSQLEDFKITGRLNKWFVLEAMQSRDIVTRDCLYEG